MADATTARMAAATTGGGGYVCGQAGKLLRVVRRLEHRLLHGSGL